MVPAAFHGGAASHVLVSPMSSSGNSQQPGAPTPQSFLIPVSALQQLNSNQSMQQQQQQQHFQQQGLAISANLGSHSHHQQPSDAALLEEHNVKPVVGTLSSSSSSSTTGANPASMNTSNISTFSQSHPSAPPPPTPPQQLTSKSFFIMSPSGQIFAVTGQLPTPHQQQAASQNHQTPTVTNVSSYQYAPSPPVYPHPPPLSPQCTFPSSNDVATSSAETKPLSSCSSNQTPPVIRQQQDLPPPNLRVHESTSSVKVLMDAHRVQSTPLQQQTAPPLSSSFSAPSTPSRENSSSRLAMTSASSNATPCDTPMNSGSSSERGKRFGIVGT